jgi:hypothetical protein
MLIHIRKYKVSFKPNKDTNMKATNNTVTTNKTEKPSKDIRSNALFTEITAEQEVFVRGGAQTGSQDHEHCPQHHDHED